MKSRDNFLSKVRGKTIAIVYIFENEDAKGFDHFLVWKNNILIGWLNAVYELECLPYIIDVRTFMQKASNHSLPAIDYVINLNSGCTDLSTMGLVPSICSFLKIPCIPCDATAILSTENKKLSNYIAKGASITIPRFLDDNHRNGIYRPINLGNSIGIKRSYFSDYSLDGVYQEFIPGYDVTIPIAYNFLTNQLDVLPPTVYYPKTSDPNWIFDEETKEKDAGLTILQFPEIEGNAKQILIEFVKIFGINTYGRIDMRIKNDTTLSNSVTSSPFSLQNCYFLEINSMPTIEEADGFDLGFKAVLHNEKYSFHECATEYCKTITNPSINGFLLACSISAISTSTY